MAQGSNNPASRQSGQQGGSGRSEQGSRMQGTSQGGTSQGSQGGMQGSRHMEKVAEAMTRDVCLATPDQTIREAATAMADADVGSLPVGDDDRLVGMITDRDIVVRAVAEGRDPETPVREVMTERIEYCFEDDDIGDVARKMADLGVRRLPVINRDKRLVGIVALSNIAQCSDGEAKKAFLEGVAAPH